VRLLAEFAQAASSQERQNAILAQLKELHNESTDATVHVLTATALMQLENYGDALRVLQAGGDNLEWCVRRDAWDAARCAGGPDARDPPR